MESTCRTAKSLAESLGSVGMDFASFLAKKANLGQSPAPKSKDPKEPNHLNTLRLQSDKKGHKGKGMEGNKGQG